MISTVLAVDPGQAGGLAVWNQDNGIELHPMPDNMMEFADLIEHHVGADASAFVYMEQVGGYIKGNPAPGSAMFNFGRGYGFVQGYCYAKGLPVVLVTPQRWLKHHHFNGGGLKSEDRKRRLKELAQRLHPGLKGITLKTCDALLLLGYALWHTSAKVGAVNEL